MTYANDDSGYSDWLSEAAGYRSWGKKRGGAYLLEPTLVANATVSNTVAISDGVNAPFDIHSPDTTILVGYHYIYLPLVMRNH